MDEKSDGYDKATDSFLTVGKIYDNSISVIATV